MKEKKRLIFETPVSNWLFYLIQFTWGLPMNILGLYMALAMLIKGAKHYRYGNGVAFELPGINWGVSMGIFMIVPHDSMEQDPSMVWHEYGHTLQNLYFGFLMPFVIFIPSAVRFWLRRWEGKGAEGYLDIWFERSASDSGEFFDKYANNLTFTIGV